MIDLAMPAVDIEPLNSLTVTPYSNMAFPSHRLAVGIVSCDGPYVAVGATQHGVPVGLAFGEVSGSLAKVHSLFVTKTERGQGVGTALLAALEVEMRRLGARKLRCGFLEKPEQTPALVRVLHKCGWPAPVPHKLFAKFTIARMLEAPFMRDYQLPPGFRVVLWRELTAEQRAALQVECEKSDWVPPRLTPFKYEVSLDERNSLAVLSEGRVVGWQLTQRLQPHVLTYSCSFVHPRFQPRGLIFKLYVDTVRLQARHAPEIPSACLVVPMDFMPMVAFVRRRFAPFLNEMNLFDEVIKECADPAAGTAHCDHLVQQQGRIRDAVETITADRR